MGLRFRKSISILPGVKLNFSKSGASVSAGVPGFRNTISTSGKLTTSVGIPGSGVSYVKTKNLKTLGKKKDSKDSKEKTKKSAAKEEKAIKEEKTKQIEQEVQQKEEIIQSEAPIVPVSQIDVNTLKSIHKMSDESIDWEEFQASAIPPDPSYDLKTWQYYHKLAPNILAGNIDTYLRAIYELNPLDDLLDYGGNFEFGTDDPKIMEVEFVINEAALSGAKESMTAAQYNDILQDYACSVCIRIARDIFALLPVEHTIVHTVLNDKTIISVDFDRETLSKVKFGFIDTSETVGRFRHNMEFDSEKGFSGVNRLF